MEVRAEHQHRKKNQQHVEARAEHQHQKKNQQRAEVPAEQEKSKNFISMSNLTVFFVLVSPVFSYWRNRLPKNKPIRKKVF